MLRGIFFDLDDTLIGYADAEKRALEAGCAVAARRYPGLDAAALEAAIYDSYDRRYAYGTPGYATLATLSVPEFLRSLTRDALRTQGVEDDALVEETIAVCEAAEWEALKAFPGAAEVLERLRPHFRLGLITNGPSAMQRAKLTAMALDGCFDAIVVDTEFGHPKPDARIFEHAAALIGLAPEALLFVGNSWEHDMMGARAAGWACVWMNPSRAPAPAGSAPDAVIASLSELLALPVVAEAMAEDRNV